ncbi:hypothetical protein NITHO_990011 [Nitrolancea hollandica Lb]|uniref:Uncharacterized protein n=1 Tax=Nitrolancea hollandica Lb TaxID=1129897 RepID=I4ENN3_9BACT|nr:hypothetical protein NITHO_990011 [Nitrolancea hollandica Lb]
MARWHLPLTGTTCSRPGYRGKSALVAHADGIRHERERFVVPMDAGLDWSFRATIVEPGSGLEPVRERVRLIGEVAENGAAVRRDVTGSDRSHWSRSGTR